MIFDDVIVPLVSGAAGAMALRLVLFAVETLRTPKPSASPSKALGLLDSHPYRALQTSQAPDVVAGCVALSDEAVRRERARVLAIVTVTGEASADNAVKAAIKAIVGGINSGT